MQFTTPRPERIEEKRIALAHMVSLEGIPWFSRSLWDGKTLTLERTTKESGALVCPWEIEPDRWMTLVSASLMEREEPYCLPVELCRGVIHRLRERSVLWQSAGYAVSERCHRLEAEALREFVKGAMHQASRETCDAAIAESLRIAFDHIDQLLEDAAPSIAAMRRGMSSKVPPFIGGWAGAVALETRNAINLTRIPLVWGEIADSPTSFSWDVIDAAVSAAEGANRKILLGPLIRWTDSELPSWLGEEVKTFDDLSTRLSQYVHAAARRYQDRAMVIEVADRVSCPTPLGLEPMQQLQLLADAVRAANNAAPTLPRMVTIGLPFGETMSVKQSELSPLHFADYLLRSEVGLSAIGLEISCGANSIGYPPRDPLDVARLLERWAALGQPMLAILHLIDGPDYDSDTHRVSLTPTFSRRTDNHRTIEYALQMLSVCFANTSVQGVLWCPEEPISGAPSRGGGDQIAIGFRRWKDGLGC